MVASLGDSSAAMQPEIGGWRKRSRCRGWRPLFGGFLVSVRPRSARGAERHPSVPDARYVLCGQHQLEPAVAVDGFGVVKVFAASVAGNDGPNSPAHGRMFQPLTLRAALLVDGGSAWKIELPSFESRNADDGHAPGVSYAKCFGKDLPDNAAVGFSLDSPRINATSVSGDCHVARFANDELRQQFAVCPLDAKLSRRWRRGVGPPDRLKFTLTFANLRAEESRDTGDGLQLELCRVNRPLIRAAFCTQPLFHLGELQRELPWVIEDWLTYHLEYLGFEHATVYDIDGTFATVAHPQWMQASRQGFGVVGENMHAGANGFTIEYHRAFPANLSRSLAQISTEYRYCTEMWAYSHCLTTHAAYSRWVMLLHAPDEYVFTWYRLQGGIIKTMKLIEASLPSDVRIGMAMVQAASFAYSGARTAEEAIASAGSIVELSRSRSDIFYRHTPVLDPMNCLASGAHSCYAESHSLREYRNKVTWIEPTMMKVHHYVEMVASLRGRCSSQHKRCDVEDHSELWVVPVLRDLAEHKATASWLHRRLQS